MHAVILQAGAVTPLLLLLALYTVSRPDKRRAHWYLAALLLAMCGWCSALIVSHFEIEPGLRSLGFDLVHLGGAVMTPLMLLTVAHYHRIELLERDRWLDVVAAAPFGFFAVAFLTNEMHHLVSIEGSNAVELGDPRQWAGPIFWAFQIWSYLYIAVAVGICVWGLSAPRTRAEQQRTWLLLGAIAGPVVAHTAWVANWLPVDYPLTPASLGLTSLFLVAGIQRFELLESTPLVRRDVIHHLRDGLLLADAGGEVVDVNPAAVEILRAAPPDLLGRPLETVVEGLKPIEASAELARDVARATSENSTLSGEIETQDGRVIGVDAAAMPAGAGQAAGRFLLLRDSTRQRQNERMLRHRQKLESVGILAAGVAHEVNNPLAFVRANLAHVQQLAEEVEKRAEDDRSRKELAELRELGEIAGESLVGLDRIARIVDGLLRFSRPSDGHGRVRVDALVEEAIRLASLHRSRSVTVETIVAHPLPELTASPDRLLQALLNLLLNARHALAGREAPCIVVACRPLGDGGAEIQVSDNGPGIPAEIRERVFDPFFTTRAPGEGTGLGLSIAFEIVQEHGGELSLDASPQGGARFTIRLPG